MATEPAAKRAVVFIDGQNLFNAVKESFGYPYPNYDVKKLAELLCIQRDWNLEQVRFYTGIPDHRKDPRRSDFWSARLLSMRRQGVEVFRRLLRYRQRDFDCPLCKQTYSVEVPVEKGVDVRIAIDVIRLGHLQKYDVALILSQDQDFSEVAAEIRTIAREQDRWIKIACAFPSSATSKNPYGIRNCDHIRIEKTAYDACIDPHDYRPKSPAMPSTPQAAAP